MIHTTYHSLDEIGVPHGTLRGNNIYLAQDEYTRQYHKVDGKTFRMICDGSWKSNEVMLHAYSGNVGVIDVHAQVVGHSYDMKTPREELESFDSCVAEMITKRLKGVA